MRILAAVLLLIVAVPVTALADVKGMAAVVDADVIRVGDKRIILYGIDSVEKKQICNLNGKPWQCYSVAVRELQILLANEPVDCKQIGELDYLGRIFAVCTIGSNILNETMVRSGWALARRKQSEDYVEAEQAAKREKLGLWQSKFAKPWDWREANGIYVDNP